MAKPPIENSEEKYPEGHELREVYIAGREAYMEDSTSAENPYRHQPHDAARARAWSDGYEDEKIWSLDSTGR